MKTLKVRKLELSEAVPPLAEVSARLDQLGKGHNIRIINWKSHGYKPVVRFNIAYSDNEVFLKYYITENSVKAEKTKSNEMVCEDSCVEFFVSPAGDGIYYNFEFNPIGTILLGSGHGRSDSVRASENHISLIRRITSLGTEPFTEIKGKVIWNITIAIPLKAFYNHNIERLNGKTFRANFYKCGDKLSVPHYVTWNPVKTEKPDFHRPEHFGILEFV